MNCINTIEKLQQLDNILMDGDKPRYQLLAFDVETNGLKIYKDVIIGFSIAFSSKKQNGFYIPLLTWVPTGEPKTRSIDKVQYSVYEDGYFLDVWTNKQYPEHVTQAEYTPPDSIIQFVSRWLQHPDVKLIMHNAIFDINMVAYNWGIELSDNLYCDTMLLHHCIDENSEQALKSIAEQWKRELGYNPEESAKREQQELGLSVIQHGGCWRPQTKEIWRASLEWMVPYGIADTVLTYGIYEVGMRKFLQEYGEAKLKWFFEEEIMPLCKYVYIPMTRYGVFIDIDYFQKLHDETKKMLDEFEQQAMTLLEPYLDTYRKVHTTKTKDATISKQALIKAIIAHEGLAIPLKNGKPSLAKDVVEAEYQKNPHWVWGYILGTDELKYTKEELEAIKQELYKEKTKRRFEFNINSDADLRWLLIDHLGNDPLILPQTDSATKKNPIPSMKTEVLETYFKDKYSFITPIVKYRKLLKIFSTYIEPALKLHNNGWIHMSVRQAGTVSGRPSCRGGLNLFTLPRKESISQCPNCDSTNLTTHNSMPLLLDLKCNDCGYEEQDIRDASAIKRGFIAPEGYKIIEADYNAAEPRVFTYISGDAKLKEVYDKNLDLYSKIYCDMFDPEGKYSADPNAENYLKKLDNEKRQLCKILALAVAYGARASQVAKLLNFKVKQRIVADDGTIKEIEKVDYDKGNYYRNRYLITYPQLHKLIYSSEIKARSSGVVETIIGRRRHLKFAYYISKLLLNMGADSEEFLEAPSHKLEAESVKELNLTKKGLYQFADYIQMQPWQIREKGCWAYIRSIYRNELNNAVNFQIQGMVAHICNRAMVELALALKQHNIDGYICLTVYDSIIVYVRSGQEEQALALVKQCMENNLYAQRISVPMKAEPKVLTSLNGD